MKKNTTILITLLLLCMTIMMFVTGCTATEEVAEPETEVAVEATEEPVEEATEEEPAAELTELEVWGVIDVQLSSQQIIADKMGYFEEEGLAVTNKFVQSGAELSPMMAGGTAKICFESTYTDIALAANNVGVTILCPVSNIGDTQTIVSAPGFEVNDPKDLEGANIGMAPGSGVLIAIRKMCSELGVDIDTFNFVALQPADQVAAMEKGDIDLMACWEPWVSKGAALGGEVLFSGLKSNLPGHEGPVEWLNFHATLQVTDEMLDEPDTLVAFLKAIDKATNYINEERDASAEILATELNLEKDLVLDIMSKNDYSIEINQGFLDGIADMSAFMNEMGNIESIPEVSTFVDSSFLAEANPDLVTVEIN